MKKRTITLMVLLSYFGNTFAQLSTHEQPVSFDKDLVLTVKARSSNPVAIMPPLDMEQIEKEDKEDEEYDMPPRFGYQHFVDYNLNNSGIWNELPNGDKLWQLNVVCPNALSVNFCFDEFWLPEGGKFFVYSKDKKQSIGAFTSKNNKGDRNHIRGFATSLVYGNDVVLEYYQPKEVSTDAIISIDYVVHGYRYIDFGEQRSASSGSCMVNINCEEGMDWQNEKLAVARIILQGHYYCTGSLITTTSLCEEPLFLTANHCIASVGKDAVADPSLDYTTFCWNYEVPGCVNGSIGPSVFTTSGATVLANIGASDFALLRLIEDPKNNSGYIPFYLGWDCSGQSGDPGVCIHHPLGDVKKLSTVAATPLSTSFFGNTVYPGGTYWKVTWKSTLNGHGTTEGGSSGSPLINANHHVIGQLHDGESNCGNGQSAPDWYGKFSTSWTGYNSIYQRLNCWLDSLNTGVQTMDGLLVIPVTLSLTTDEQLYSNIHILSTGSLTVQSDVELMGSSRIIVDAGGQLIIDGGKLSNVDLDLKPGSSLQIKNGGRIETRNGLNAPLGATVNIKNGQIK